MTTNYPHPVAGLTTSLLRATQVIRDRAVPIERAEAILESAFELLRTPGSGANSNQVTAIFAWTVLLAERQINRADAYNDVIEKGRALLQLQGLWPSTRAYIHSELARCCVTLILISDTYETRQGYHRALQSFVQNALKDISQVSPTASKSITNRQVRVVICECLAFSAAFQEDSRTLPALHAKFWNNLTEAEKVARGSKSLFERLILKSARLLICRVTAHNTQELRVTWARTLERLDKFAEKHPFAGSRYILLRGYQHLAAISRLTKDHSRLTAAALGIATILERDPENAPERDNYLSFAYEASCANGDTKGAEEVLTKCRVLNFRSQFSRTPRLRLFAARKVFDPEPEALLSKGAIYAELFRSVTEPTKESSEVSLKVAQVLISQSAGEFIDRVLSVFDLCQTIPLYRESLSESIRNLLGSLAPKDVAAPCVGTLTRLREVLPDQYKSLTAVINIRRLILLGQSERAENEAYNELKISPKGPKNYLRPELHLLAALAELSLGKLSLAAKHVDSVLDREAKGSETTTRRKLLGLALGFICAFRSDDKDKAAARYGEFVEYLRYVECTRIFKNKELRDSHSLATAIQERILRGSLYEDFEMAQFKNS